MTAGAALIVGALIAGFGGDGAVAVEDSTRAGWRERVAIEIGGGAAVGEAAVAESGPQWHPGGAWRAGAAVALARGVELYAGYGRRSFECRTGFCAGDPVGFVSSGLDAGGRVLAGPLWAQAGVVRHTLGAQWTSGTAGSERENAAPALGWELGAGLRLPLGPAELLPGVRYAAYRTRFAGAAGDDAVGYLAAELGVRVTISRLWR